MELKHVNLSKHHLAGMELYETEGHVFLKTMLSSTATAKIPDWGSRLRGAWLIKVGNTVIPTIGGLRCFVRYTPVLAS